MTHTARTIVFDGGLPIPATVTATRRDKPPAGMTLVKQDRQRSQYHKLHALLITSGIPADNWEITTDPPDRSDHLIQWPGVTMAGLAAVIRAAQTAEDGKTPADWIFSGTWTHNNLHGPPDRPLTTRGLAIQARFAAEHGRILITHYDNSRASRDTDYALRRSQARFPRDRSLRYVQVASGTELIDVVHGRIAPDCHQPAETTTTSLNELPDDAGVLAIPTHALRAILPPFEHAVQAGTPLLVSAAPNAMTSRPTREEAVAQLAVLLMPELTPREQQGVLETLDLADQDPPLNAAGHLQRPSRRPHWTTRPEAFHSTKTPPSEPRNDGQPPVPSETDLAARGVLTVGVDPGRRLDHGAAETLVDDWRSRTGDRYQLIAMHEGPRQEVQAELRRTHPLMALPYAIVPWPAPSKRTADQTGPGARRAKANRELIQAARRRLAVDAPDSCTLVSA